MKNKTLGVIIGRFQTPYLHAGHKALLDAVQEKSDRMLVFVGCTSLKNTTKDPLDYPTRFEMIRQAYPHAEISALYDTNEDELWSNKVDAKITEQKGSYKPTLYGGRDSFIPYYKPYGKYPVEELQFDQEAISATEIRLQVEFEKILDAAQRTGIIHAAMNRYPHAQAAVDIAVLKITTSSILLGRKANETKWRLPGGFVDPQQDESYEEAAKRELMEECGSFEISHPEYLMSKQVDDYRYKDLPDKIYTSLYSCIYIFGKPVAGDDLAEVKWFSIKDLLKDDYIKEHVMQEHIELVKKAIINDSRRYKKGISKSHKKKMG